MGLRPSRSRSRPVTIPIVVLPSTTGSHTPRDPAETVTARIDVDRGLELIPDEFRAAVVLRDLAGLEPRPLPAIRRSERSAFEMRKAGNLAHEHAASAAPDSPASHLAADYATLAAEVFGRIDGTSA